MLPWPSSDHGWNSEQLCLELQRRFWPWCSKYILIFYSLFFFLQWLSSYNTLCKEQNTNCLREYLFQILKLAIILCEMGQFQKNEINSDHSWQNLHVNLPYLKCNTSSNLKKDNPNRLVFIHSTNVLLSSYSVLGTQHTTLNKTYFCPQGVLSSKVEGYENTNYNKIW